MSETVICFVDGDNVDSYVAIAALKPATAILIHPTARAGEAAAVGRVVNRRLGVECRLESVADVTNAREVADLFESLPKSAHLHYTGGEGTISSSLRAAHGSIPHEPESASFLDLDRRLLRFDGGVDVSLDEVCDPQTVSLDVFLELGGFERVSTPDSEHRERTLRRQADALIDAIWPLDWEYLDSLGTDGSALLEAIRVQLDPLQPTEGPFARPGRWTPFRQGGFFEHLFARLVADCAPEYDIDTGVILRGIDGPQQLELDIIAVGQFKAHVFSCMAGTRGSAARDKTFEVIVRARQVGGTTMRPILVTALDDQSKPRARHLRELMETHAFGPAPEVDVIGRRRLCAIGRASVSERREILGLPPVS